MSHEICKISNINSLSSSFHWLSLFQNSIMIPSLEEDLLITFLFKCKAFSDVSISPFDMIPIRSPMIYASSRKWVETMMILSCLRDFMISQNFLLEVGSSPVVGSSRSNILVLRINAIPNTSFLCSPYEICFGNDFLSSNNFTFLRTSHTT